MKAFLTLLLFIGIAAGAGDITASKDSLRVYNNDFSSFFDMLTIRDTGGNPVALDSVIILLDEFDTAGMGNYSAGAAGFEVHWIDTIQKGDFSWSMNETATNRFRLVKKFFSPNDTAIPLRMAPGDSCGLSRFRIGYYLVSAHYPLYPRYLHGTLQLYFDNGQILELQLKSEDLRTVVIAPLKIGTTGTSGSARLTGRGFLLNGRAVIAAPDASNEFIRKLKNGWSAGNSLNPASRSIGK